MKRIALTGGIGSGKSVVGRIFTMLRSAAIYDSDQRAKELMESDEKLIEAIKSEFDEDIYSGGKLDRKALADKIFGNDAALQKLNSLVHPVVMCDFGQWAKNLKDAEFAIIESAIIIDNNLEGHFDAVITISAPLELRVKRAMERDGATREATMARVAAQITDAEREQKADYVVINDEKHSLWEQMITLNL